MKPVKFTIYTMKRRGKALAGESYDMMTEDDAAFLTLEHLT